MENWRAGARSVGNWRPGAGARSASRDAYSGGMSDSAPAPRRSYEYVTVPLITHATKAILDNWGTDGWELVQVVPGPGPEQLVAYMKREK